MKRAVAASLLFAAVLFGQVSNPAHEAIRLLQKWRPNRNKAERLLRTAVEQNPDDAESLELLTILLHGKVGRDPSRARETQPYADNLLRLRENSPNTNPPELALALELSASLRQTADMRTEPDPLSVRAAEIRKRLVRDVQGIGDQYTPCERMPRRESAAPRSAVQAPRLVYKQEPVYSDLARWAAFQGTVVLVIKVDVDGRAKEVRLLRSIGFGLDEKAVNAVQAWEFEPGQKNGEPVPVCAEVEVNFRLR